MEIAVNIRLKRLHRYVTDIIFHQAVSYLPNRKPSLPFGHYQIIQFGVHNNCIFYFKLLYLIV